MDRPPPVSQPPTLAPQDKRILLLNGVPEISRFVSRTLSRANHKVLSVDNADDGLALARQESLDLVIVDLWLSGQYDLGMVRRLAALHGPPVVVLSDPPRGDELQRTLAAGAVDYIISPVSSRELLQRIQMALTTPLQSPPSQELQWR